mmetsp:Transcript_55776/g.104623  ORF Transcript_55776/g.104623 Transcript_55776/m.104623 type:complete len:530 (+) Transcript_55776:27-1616(+)
MSEAAHLSVEDETESELLSNQEAAPPRRCRRYQWSIFVGSGAFIFMVLLIRVGIGHSLQETNLNGIVEEFTMPRGAGVNLGGWFVLEDWFFSGSDGRFVMSEEKGQGKCLPPLLRHIDKPWPSEGVLAFELNASLGADETTKIFKAHREAFFTKDEFRQIVTSGIDTIRLPLTWAAFADALAPLNPVYAAHNANTDTVLVPDPFYHDKVAFATIPRAKLVGFLRQAAQSGLKVVLDLHAFPGGSQDGTYNGIWPHKPVFWTKHTRIGGQSVPLSQTGRWVVQALIRWAEALDPEAKKGIKGITIMNEPAHTNAWTHFAEENDVLDWLSSAANDFRMSSLPEEGVKLYVNLIETAFEAFEHSAVPWFLATFSEKERATWAVADVHWYVAWSNGACDGRTVKGGAYSCSAPLAEVQRKLHWCAKDASSRLRFLFGKGLVAVTEFSAGTFHTARYACSESNILRAFLNEQVSAFTSDNIEPFFWTWKMPFGPNFEPGWSLKYILGLETDSDRAGSCADMTGNVVANVSLVHF